MRFFKFQNNKKEKVLHL